MKLRRLSGADFDQIAASTRMRGPGKMMARAVLVDGRAQSDVAAEYGVSRQRVNLAVASIERRYIDESGSAGGVVQVSLVLPERVALELEKVTELLNACKDARVRNAALKQLLAGIESVGELIKEISSEAE
jgi:hypothetical protein